MVGAVREPPLRVQRGSAHYLTVNPSYVRLCKEPLRVGRMDRGWLLWEGLCGDGGSDRATLLPTTTWSIVVISARVRADLGAAPSDYCFGEGGSPVA